MEQIEKYKTDISELKVKINVFVHPAEVRLQKMMRSVHSVAQHARLLNRKKMPEMMIEGTAEEVAEETATEETDETVEEANADTAEDAVTTEETVEEAAEAEEAAQTDAEEQTEAEGGKEE